MREFFERWKRRLGAAFDDGNGWGLLWLGGVSVLVCLSPGLARGLTSGDWSSLGRLAAGVALLVATAAALVAGYRWFGSRAYDLGHELQDVFGDYDLEFDGGQAGEVSSRERIEALGRGSERAPEIVGEWWGRSVRVRRGVGGGDRSIYEVDVSGDVPGDLVIRNRSLPTLTAKYVGFEELQSGHNCFERTYVARARDADRGERVLNERGLGELFGETLVERAPEVHLEEGRLRLVREEEPANSEAVAERLEQLRASTEAFVRHVDGSEE